MSGHRPILNGTKCLQCGQAWPCQFAKPSIERIREVWPALADEFEQAEQASRSES